MAFRKIRNNVLQTVYMEWRPISDENEWAITPKRHKGLFRLLFKQQKDTLTNPSFEGVSIHSWRFIEQSFACVSKY